MCASSGKCSRGITRWSGSRGATLPPGSESHPPRRLTLQWAKDHAEAIKKLSGLRGAAFDRAFLAHEAAFHKAVLDALTTTLLPALQNAEVKELVNKVAPAFTAHMLKAQSLLDAYPKG